MSDTSEDSCRSTTGVNKIDVEYPIKNELKFLCGLILGNILLLLVVFAIAWQNTNGLDRLWALVLVIFTPLVSFVLPLICRLVRNVKKNRTHSAIIDLVVLLPVIVMILLVRSM